VALRNALELRSKSAQWHRQFYLARLIGPLNPTRGDASCNRTPVGLAPPYKREGLEMKGLMIGAVSTLLIALPAYAKKSEQTPLDFGKQPSFSEAVTVGETYVKQRLVDPESARFDWPYNFVADSLKSAFGKRRTGYWTCGYVNARNRMGGYSGRSLLFIMVRDGQVIDYDLDPGDGLSIAGATCGDAIKHNRFPNSPLADYLAAAAAPGQGRPIGIQVQPTAPGLLITSIAPESPADRAGLKVGNLISGVNGEAMIGLTPSQMLEKVKQKGDVLVLDVVSVGKVSVNRRP
jgi:hypothetical protein